MFLPQCEQQETLLVSRIVQTGSGAHSANYSVATGALLSGVKHLGHKYDYLLVPRVRVRGAITPFSLHDVVLKQEKTSCECTFILAVAFMCGRQC